MMRLHSLPRRLLRVADALASLGRGLVRLTWNICENWRTFCPSSTMSWPVTRTRIEATVADAGCASRVTTRWATFVNGSSWVSAIRRIMKLAPEESGERRLRPGFISATAVDCDTRSIDCKEGWAGV